MIKLDGRKMLVREEAFAYLREALNLPEWFGCNLDALYDMLTGWEIDGDIVLKLPAEQSDFFKSLLSVFTDAAAENGGIKLTVI